MIDVQLHHAAILHSSTPISFFKFFCIRTPEQTFEHTRYMHCTDSCAQRYDVKLVSTKPHPLERLGAASPAGEATLHEWAFRRRMSPYTTQFQGPAMAATQE